MSKVIRIYGKSNAIIPVDHIGLVVTNAVKGIINFYDRNGRLLHALEVKDIQPILDKVQEHIIKDVQPVLNLGV